MKIRVRWQQALRLALAIFAIGFTIIVYRGIRERQPPAGGSADTPRTDPTAVAESTRGTSMVAKGSEQDFTVEYDRALTYDDGSLRFEGVKVLVPQRGGRDFRVTSDRATVANSQSDVLMEGNVRLGTSDGLTATAESATYQNADGMLRVPGPVAFEKGRMKGQGRGATYDRERDVLWLLSEARIAIVADPGTGLGEVEVTAGSAGFARSDRYLRFEGGVRMVRDANVIEADSAVAYLAADEDRLEMLELRGQSRVQSAATGPGGLEAMTARDMNLTYGPDGRQLQRAALAGDARLQIAGPAGRDGRRLTANWVEFTLADDGSTLTSLTARDGVELLIPADNPTAPSRRIRSVALEGSGDPGKGLTTVRFLDNVDFREQRQATRAAPAVDRQAHSRTLDARMQPGLGGLDRAAFGGGVTFKDGTTQAQAPDATYDLTRGTLSLVGAPGGARARVDDERITVDARTIDLALETDGMVADGDVRTTLKADSGSAAPAQARRRPGMLRNDEPANVTAGALAYDSATGRATYTGDARLWQGETAVLGRTITLDDREGNLTAKGNVRSTWRLEDTDPKTARREKKTTVATAQELIYQDDTRRASYTGRARMIGPEGDLRAEKIDLYLNESGDALDRLEAFVGVVLQSESKTSTGETLTYFASDARYVMAGAPVRVLEQKPTECRETLGKTLTFFRSTDTILVDGNDVSRTQSTSGGKCPAPPPGE